MIKKSFISGKTKKALRKNKNQRKSIPFDQAKKIGLLIDDKVLKNPKAFNETVLQLVDQGKRVEAICFIENVDLPKLAFPHQYLSMKDFSWNGKINNDQVKKFIKTEFDYLFSLNTSPFLLFESILASSAAKCRIGCYQTEDQGCFEMVIGADPTKASLFKQMLDYVKLI